MRREALCRDEGKQDGVVEEWSDPEEGIVAAVGIGRYAEAASIAIGDGAYRQYRASPL